MSTITTVESPPKASWDFGIPRSRRTGSADPNRSFSFKNLVPKRKRRATSVESTENDAPPPPPPKDEDHDRQGFAPSVYSSKTAALDRSSHEGDHVITLSHVNLSTHGFEISAPPLSPYLRTTQNRMEIVPFKRPHEPPRIFSPAEKARLRLETERERVFETRVALQEEEERQLRLKAEKEEILRRSDEEEVRRKAKMERDLRKAAVNRMERERAQREADAFRAQELQEKKKSDRERRLLESQKWQAWRDEQDRRREILALKKDDEKRQTHEEKRVKRRELYDRLRAAGTEGVLLTGWLSMQTSRSMTWKRRYFTLNETALQLYRAPADLSQPIDSIPIVNIRDVRDGGDVSEEEPEFIPNSFTVEESEGCCWSIFTDTREAKDTLIAVLVHAAGVDDNHNSTYSGFFSRIPRLAGN